MQTLPEAPRVPIVVVLRRGTTEGHPSEGVLHAILPYVDLPEELLASGHFAFMLTDGTRGVISRETIEEHTEDVSPYDDSADEMTATFKQHHWAPVFIPYAMVDHDAHRQSRKDDGQYDYTAPAVFSELNSIVSCENCGHPNLSKAESCEACGFSLKGATVTADLDVDALKRFQQEWE